jgi:hypothetical protein
MPRATVTYKGPFFEAARRNAVLRKLEVSTREEIGKDAVNTVQVLLDAVLKHQTPYYRTQIKAQNMATETIVTDSRVIYGPWLEGTSQRNKTTRFKGYHTFRRAQQILPQRAHAIARRNVTRAVRELGG